MKRRMIKAYLGIGSNLGNRRKNIDLAIQKLQEIKDVGLLKISDIIETEPVGGPPQGKFLNGAIEIETSLTPENLLSSLKEIERTLGRRKSVKNGPRVSDLDILLYGDIKIDTHILTIPHPRMLDREFVMKPLAQIRCAR